MDKKIYIPIAESILTAHKNDCFYFLTYLRFQITDIDATLTNLMKTVLVRVEDNFSKWNYKERLDISKQTWSKLDKTDYGVNFELRDEPVSFMDEEIFDRLYAAILTLPKRSRNSYMYFYCYLYFQIHRQHMIRYERSIETLAIETGSDTNTTMKKINFFAEADLLWRVGKYKFSGDKTFSYAYKLPEGFKSSFK